MADLVGQQLGNYRLLRLLGRGAFAAVYLGQHVHLERQAAIKVLHVQIAAANQKAFRREARTIARLDHPHIIGIYDFDIQDQTPYLVMEYLPNGTLRHHHPKGSKLSIAQMSTYVQQIAQALDYAHEHQVIHRDIKPENLLLKKDGEVVLSDFGIAILSSPQASLSSQHPAGTPLYMAPEQIRGHPCAASDQYALGVIAYEWLCGQPPFAGSGLAVLAQHLHEPPPRFLIQEAVEQTVFRALAKEPEQRFGCVTDFAMALSQAFVAGSLGSRDETTLALAGANPTPTAPEHTDDPTQLPTRNQLEEKHQQVPRVSSPRPPHEQVRSHKNRERMLRRLRRSYRDLLAQSLQGIAWMELGLTELPDAVENVTNLALQIAPQVEQALPLGISITQVYEDAAQELLILGEPGAGKSTELLHLAQDLVSQAETDETCLLPVILPLSFWAIKQGTLADWMIEQIAQAYDIPRKVSQQWVQEEQILPLLDGLDEMEDAARPACIAAINAYHRAHLTPLVVCSRTTEYESAAGKQRLELQSAVVVRPLTSAQVDAALVKAGETVAGLRTKLQEQPPLQELATTPLMLNVLMLTYQGATVRLGLFQQETDLEQQIWTDYVERMVERKRKGHVRRYSLLQTQSWLGWLAREMRLHNQTVFYAERLQADWLPNRLLPVFTWLAERIPAIIIGVLASLLVWSFFLANSSDHPTLFQVGLLGGYLGILMGKETETPTNFPSKKKHPLSLLVARFGSSLLLAVLLGASFGLLESEYSSGLRNGLIFGMGVGGMGWLLSSVLLHVTRYWRSSLARPIFHPSLQPRWFTNIHLRRAVVIALVSGAVYGLCNELNSSSDLSVSLSQGLSVGLSFGFTGFLLSFILTNEGGRFHLAERLHWNARHLIRPRHLGNSLLVAGLLFLTIGLNVLLLPLLGQGYLVEKMGGIQNYMLRFVLGSALGIGLSIGLNYWLLFGLAQGIVQKQVEDQDRRSFNQGIFRSFRNGFLISLLSGGIILGVGTLSTVLGLVISSDLWSIIPSGFGSGLNYGLSTGLNHGLSYGPFVVLGGGLLVWAMVGGLAVFRHYLLRLMLACSHTFPWQAQRFLDDAAAHILMRRVGGGYSFVHRRFLDYFADAGSLPVLPPRILARKQPSGHPFSKLLAKINLTAAVLVVAAIIGSFLILSILSHSGRFATARSSSNVVALHDTPIYFVTDEAKSVVYAVRSSDGSTIWQYTLGQKPVNQAVFADGDLFFPSYDGKIYALKASDGQPFWQTRVASGNESIPAGPIQAFGNLIFTGTSDGHLYALNAETGVIAWNDRIPTCPTNGPNPSDQITESSCNVVSLQESNGVIYGFADGLYAWNATNGSVLWHNTQYQFGPQFPVVSHGKIYLPSVSGNRIDVLDASNGHFLHTLGNFVSARRFPWEMTVNDNALYIADSSLFAYRLSDDSLLWEVNKPLGNLRVTNDRIYAVDVDSSGNPSSKGTLYALNTTDGTQLWSVQNLTAGYLDPLFEVNGIVIAISNTGIHAIRASDGWQLWQGFEKLQIQWPVAG